MRHRWLILASLPSMLAAEPAAGQAASGTAAGAEEPVEVEVVVVAGRQPGPPLWRVENGDNVLYIGSS